MLPARIASISVAATPSSTLVMKWNVARTPACDSQRESKHVARPQPESPLKFLNSEAAKYQDLAIRTGPDAEDPDTGVLLKPYYESLAVSQKQKAVAKALELSEGYGDLFEAGPGEGGWAFGKPRAQSPPQLSGRPTKRGSIQAGEDPNVRAYANQYFGGDYAAAVEAIKRQRQK